MTYIQCTPTQPQLIAVSRLEKSPLNARRTTVKVGMAELKASLLAHDDEAVDELARWTLELGTAAAESPIGRYAATLALLALGRWAEARHVAESLRSRDDFPHDVADALAFIAAHDVIGYCESVESVVTSFETRDEFLEDAAVPDTALVLAALARRRHIDEPLPASPTLPD